MAGEGISNFIAAQRVLLNLAQRENEILTTVVKERIGGPAPVAALTDLFSRGVDTVIGMQQHFLTLAARQTDEWIDATKSGEPFGRHPVDRPGAREHGNLRAQPEEVPGRLGRGNRPCHRQGNQRQAHPAPKKTELTELARQSAEAYIDAQKKLLDVATQQLKVNAKTAREAIGAMNPLPAETLGELAKHTIEGLVESEQDLLDVIVKPPRQAPKAQAAPAHPKPARKPRRRPAQACSRDRVRLAPVISDGVRCRPVLRLKTKCSKPGPLGYTDPNGRPPLRHQ